MARAKSKRPDPVAYARSCRSDDGGRRSWFTDHPDAADVVRAFVQEWKAGRSAMSHVQAVSYLKRYYGYPRTVSAFRQYLVTHHGEVARG